MTVIWTPRAMVRATETVEGLFARIERLRRHPRLGQKVPEVYRDEIRQVRYGRYRVVYRIDPRRIVVLTIRHYAREWDPAEVQPEERPRR